MQRHIIQAESEFDKQRALFEQEKSAKERELMTERQSHKSGLTSELSQI